MVCGVINHSRAASGCGETTQLVLAVELPRPLHVAEEIVGLDHEPAVVAPAIGMANLASRASTACRARCARAGSDSHAASVIAWRNAATSVATSASARALDEAGKCCSTYKRPDGVAEKAVDQAHASLPVRTRELLSAQHAAEELEPRVRERAVR